MTNDAWRMTHDKCCNLHLGEVECVQREGARWDRTEQRLPPKASTRAFVRGCVGAAVRGWGGRGRGVSSAVLLWSRAKNRRAKRLGNRLSARLGHAQGNAFRILTIQPCMTHLKRPNPRYWCWGRPEQAGGTLTRPTQSLWRCECREMAHRPLRPCTKVCTARDV